MTFEEIIKKGKSLLAQHGVVEENLSHESGLLEPQVPGLGASGERITFKRNRLALTKYFIKNRILGEHFSPKTEIELFGARLSFPILAAPMSGIKTNLNGSIEEKKFLQDILKGCKDSGTIGMCGDSFDTTSDYLAPGVIKDIGGIGVCKPREFNILKDRIEKLGEVQAAAVGIDLDGVSGKLLETGQVTRKNKEELIKIRQLFKGPMFLKGILSVEDAVLAYKAGFDAIVISNHGGRSIDYSLGTADILPLIAKKLKGKIKILVDGGVKNGYDVFVYLALGADAILVGRTILYSVVGGGADGVNTAFAKFSSDLSRAMIFAGCKSIKDINYNHLGKYE